MTRCSVLVHSARILSFAASSLSSRCRPGNDLVPGQPGGISQCKERSSGSTIPKDTGSLGAMMARTYSFITPRSAGMAIGRCRKVTLWSSRSCKDQRDPKRQTYQNRAYKSHGNYFGPAGEPCRPFSFGWNYNQINDGFKVFMRYRKREESFSADLLLARRTPLETIDYEALQVAKKRRESRNKKLQDFFPERPQQQITRCATIATMSSNNRWRSSLE